VILSYKHNGLARFALKGDPKGIATNHRNKIKKVLSRLAAIRFPHQMDIPGYNFHSLKGNYEEYYSIKISGNWRVIFRMKGEHVYDVDYIDYH
jgi:proteic killer suppression protein